MNLDEIEDLIRRYLSAGIAVVLILIAPVTGGEAVAPRDDPTVVTVDPTRTPAPTTTDRADPTEEDDPDLDARGPADTTEPGLDDEDATDEDSPAGDTADDDTAADDTADDDTADNDTADEDAADADTPGQDTADEERTPSTGARETDTPESEARETDTPETDAPDSDAPDPDSPESDARDTDRPETDGPETDEVSTDDPADRDSTSTTPTTPRAPAAPSSSASGNAPSAAERLGWGTPDREDDFASGLSQWQLYEGPGHADQGARSPEALSVRDGVLTITGDATGTTGGMSWGQGQRYGRWEGRVRAPASDPSYNALLLLWPDAEDFPVGGEIDFMEMQDPARQRTDFFLHHGADDEQVNGEVEIDATQWHNWAVEWTPDAITAYVDGEQWFRTTDTETFPPGPMHLCIQLDWFPDAPGQVRESTMEVDWVRQYAAP